MENISERSENKGNLLKIGTDIGEEIAQHVNVGHDTSWFNNNNNSLITREGVIVENEKKNFEATVTESNINAQNKWNCESCEAVVGVGVSLKYKNPLEIACGSGTEEDEGGGVIEGMAQIQLNQHNGTTTPISNRPIAHMQKSSTLPAIPPEIQETGIALNLDYDAFAGGAASLTPPGNSQSNRTSINNSTENLSFSSGNYYPDDLILLDDDDVEAEEISLNSDDCVYAYRGDGADFDLALDTLTRRGGTNSGLIDDETDFLEMDFEPDPLSEVEYGSMDTHADTFLLQRDSYHLSGRHSANTLSIHGNSKANEQRQLFSSPIDDLPATANALQTQSMLSKNYARINMHLDQIKGENGDCDGFERASIERLLSANSGGFVSEDMTDNLSVTTSTAHSLPNTLHGNFGINLLEQHESQEIPSKITGAKPKRLSTFSISSSTSSKNSSKSRNSLRSSFALTICNSSSFDERSVSCTEFRSAQPPVTSVATDDCPNTVNTTCDDFNSNDETCWDCLEKEFLATTIGKAMDPNECVKCRNKRKSGCRSYYGQVDQLRCRSGSPSLFNDIHDDSIFDKEWFVPIKNKMTDNSAVKVKVVNAVNHAGRDGVNSIDVVALNQRNAMCDKSKGEKLLKSFLLTEQETTTIPNVNLNEETLSQALEKLHISYNAELLKAYFKSRTTTREYKSLQHFILHESKKNCNYPKIKRLIELVTQHQVKVDFKKDTNVTHREWVRVKVVDIIHQWTRTKNLDLLKKLDKRFIDANVLGKIANIVRQAEQSCTPRRPLPEFIIIPQYYETSYLTLTKKC